MAQLQAEHMFASTIFTLERKDVSPFAAVNGAPKLSRGSFTIRYAGELDGEGQLEELHFHHDAQAFSSHGYERFVGWVQDRQGSFVYESSGQFYDGQIHSRREILSGSGTGELEGIRGICEFTSGPAEEFEANLEFWFETA